MFMEKSGRYKLFLIVPVLLLITSTVILFTHYSETGEWFERSIQLKGGMLITVDTNTPASAIDVESLLSENFGDVHVRELSGFSGHGLLIETASDTNSTEVIEELENAGISIIDISVESIGPSLGESFWSQAQLGIIMAFVFMGIIVFAIFRIFIPSFAVIMCGISDIIVTLALMQVFGIELSLASFAALLMLIGYSIDTDIMLTTRLIRTRDDSLNNRLKNTLKTGLTMTGTTIGVLVALLLSGASIVLAEIASVLLIGLVIDIINTWLQNSVLLKWYCERRGME